jgi:hypothetical protein
MAVAVVSPDHDGHLIVHGEGREFASFHATIAACAVGCIDNGNRLQEDSHKFVVVTADRGFDRTRRLRLP